MNRLLVAGIALCVLGTGYAEFSVAPTGTWPASWPKELEPLRKQAQTFVGPKQEFQNFAITFTNREEFEAAWPHILKVKAKDAPVHLVRGPHFFLSNAKGGVVIHCPPADAAGAVGNALSITVMVDGEIVDLNRFPLPADTPIADERFKEVKGR